MEETREIPRDNWNDFFSSFTRQHEDESVAVEVMGAEIGAQVEGRELHLRGISPAANTDVPDLALMLDAQDGTHLTHMISKPTHVWLQRAPDEVEEALEIQSADGTSTLLRFGAHPRGDQEPIKRERFPRKGDDEDLA